MIVGDGDTVDAVVGGRRCSITVHLQCVQTGFGRRDAVFVGLTLGVAGSQPQVSTQPEGVVPETLAGCPVLPGSVVSICSIGVEARPGGVEQYFEERTLLATARLEDEFRNPC